MKKVVIKRSMAPIYKDSKRVELCDEGIYGTYVTILDELEDLYKIKTFYDYEGYIDKNCLEIDEDKILLWNNLNKNIINHYYVDINNKDNIKSQVIINLVRGEVVGIGEESDSEIWKKVYLVTGEEGYIRKQFLKSFLVDDLNIREDKFRKDVVNVALSYLNTQYKWGGKSNLGIDCSGLCFMSYLINSVIINRDSTITEKFPIKEIKIGVIKKGDLIFFPEHVGMYIGDGKYIHSSSSKGVVTINSLDEKSELYDEKLYKSIEKAGSIFENIE